MYSYIYIYAHIHPYIYINILLSLEPPHHVPFLLSASIQPSRFPLHKCISGERAFSDVTHSHILHTNVMLLGYYILVDKSKEVKWMCAKRQ